MLRDNLARADALPVRGFCTGYDAPVKWPGLMRRVPAERIVPGVHRGDPRIASDLEESGAAMRGGFLVDPRGRSAVG